MRADVHVVRDLDLVVEPYVFFKYGVVQRAAIDRGVGADFAVVADAHAAELRQLDPAAVIERVVIECEAETIRADHCAGMYQHAFAQCDPGYQCDPRHQSRLRTDRAIGADDAMRTEHDAVFDDSTIFDHAAGTNAGTGADTRVAVDHRAGVDARWCGR